MTAEGVAGLLWLPGARDPLGRPNGWTWVGSVTFHIAVLAAVALLRSPYSVERPAPSYEVALVTLPAPITPTPAVTTEPERSPTVLPRPQPPRPAPAPVVKPRQPTPLPAVTPPPPVPPPVEPPKAIPMVKLQALPSPTPDRQRAASTSQNLMKDVLKGIELPPEAPTLAEASPSVDEPAKPKTPASPPKEIDSLLRKLTVPELAPAPEKIPVPATADPAPMRSVVEELQRELQRLQEAPQAPRRETPAKSAEAPVATLPKRPTTMITSSLAAPGLNQYLSVVQSKISRMWVAPQVDLTRRSLEVIIKFRLHRTGAVTDVVVERSSGNEYYDAAGKRAILSAYPLPPFPKQMTDAYLDAHFSFAVGEPSG